MNERFEALYDQAFTLGTSGYSNGELDVEKFAELIVKECADLNFRSTGHVTTDGEIAIGDMIRNHFGVEE
jgi:hypothetical protein